MPKVHIIQTYDYVRDQLADAFKAAGYEVETHAVNALQDVRASFLDASEPFAVVTSQVNSRFSPCSLFVGNEVAGAAKDAKVPTLTIVYSSIDPEDYGDLNDTKKDTVQLVHKGLTGINTPVLLSHVNDFFQKHKIA